MRSPSFPRKRESIFASHNLDSSVSQPRFRRSDDQEIDCRFHSLVRPEQGRGDSRESPPSQVRLIDKEL